MGLAVATCCNALHSQDPLVPQKRVADPTLPPLDKKILDDTDQLEKFVLDVDQATRDVTGLPTLSGGWDRFHKLAQRGKIAKAMKKDQKTSLPNGERIDVLNALCAVAGTGDQDPQKLITAVQQMQEYKDFTISLFMKIVAAQGGPQERSVDRTNDLSDDDLHKITKYLERGLNAKPKSTKP
jgi:hypothetical protein